MTQKMKIISILLGLIILLYAHFTECDTNSSIENPAAAIHFDCSGMLGGKLNRSTFTSDSAILRNHGYFYSCINARYSYNDIASVKTRFRLLNDELSKNDEYVPQFEPEIDLSYKAKSIQYSLLGGFIDHFTLGEGLTIKDFSQSGAFGTIGCRVLEVSAGIFTSGYGKNEDIYLLTAKHCGFPIKFSSFMLREQRLESDKDGYYNLIYALPGFEYKYKGLTFYAEYGYKIQEIHDLQGLFTNCPQKASAGLAGIKADFQKKAFAVSGCLELRASQKGFIPATGVEIAKFAKFWNENDSRANWVDFFDSQEDFYWVYATIDLSVPLFRHCSAFLRDELLYFSSSQKLLLPQSADTLTSMEYPGILSYQPSTHVYNIGIRFDPLSGVSIEASVKNKLMNKLGFNACTYNQWGQRFFVTESPFFEARVIWYLGDS
jgi:hypothetical protein